MSDRIAKEFPNLLTRFGRETVAKGVAVELLIGRKLSVDEIIEYTGLSRHYVETLKVRVISPISFSLKNEDPPPPPIWTIWLDFFTFPVVYVLLKLIHQK